MKRVKGESDWRDKQYELKLERMESELGVLRQEGEERSISENLKNSLLEKLEKEVSVQKR